MKFAVDPDLHTAAYCSSHFEGMELVLSVLPTGLFCAVLFAVLAHHQEGTCAFTPAVCDAALRVTVVLILEGVVEADEVVLVLESEDVA